GIFNIQEMQLFYFYGRVLQRISASDRSMITLDVAALRPGIYFLRVWLQGGSYFTEKVVVH
ncbi:MAG: T9SS type A sorting domain-containing protein, partial [Muricauda sp.]|nr:T9SS type A sorting domain-containing protein [Allomuricauda sp.]